MEEKTTNEEIRIGVYTCHCGLNIASAVDCKGVAEHISQMPDVVLSKDITYLCAEPGQMEIKQDIS